MNPQQEHYQQRIDLHQAEQRRHRGVPLRRGSFPHRKSLDGVMAVVSMMPVAVVAAVDGGIVAAWTVALLSISTPGEPCCQPTQLVMCEAIEDGGRRCCRFPFSFVNTISAIELGIFVRWGEERRCCVLGLSLS